MERSFVADSRLHELGACEYGLTLISEVIKPRVPSTDMPLFLAFGLTDSLPHIINELRRRRSGWAIKYSCRGENDFTSLAQRGDNSSIGRTINFDVQTSEFARRRLERAFRY